MIRVSCICFRWLGKTNLVQIVARQVTVFDFLRRRLRQDKVTDAKLARAHSRAPAQRGRRPDSSGRVKYGRVHVTQSLTPAFVWRYLEIIMSEWVSEQVR